MRLWSLHPVHLDARGLVALWREGLLARAVLKGETRGYTHHPQLDRFRHARAAVTSLDCYLSRVVDEARVRSYRFDASKIRYRKCRGGHLSITDGQLAHEWQHLLRKLRARDRARFAAARALDPSAHPCFDVVPGEIADWERPGARRLTPLRGNDDSPFHGARSACADGSRGRTSCARSS